MAHIPAGTRVVVRNHVYKTEDFGRLTEPVIERGYGIVTIIKDDGTFFRTEGAAYLLPKAVVENPDSASHFICDGARAPMILDGLNYRRVTHHLVGASQRCTYCKRPAATILKEAGL